MNGISVHLESISLSVDSFFVRGRLVTHHSSLLSEQIQDIRMIQVRLLVLVL